ncbi:MAG TPA: hypothetical protein VMR62_00015 [Bryobacteraceae bacterium]|jgi:hypothetical protein|nr:hypothetical protein [Bryobacteraceae bacterium]
MDCGAAVFQETLFERLTNLAADKERLKAGFSQDWLTAICAGRIA